jgi:cyanophycinase-like exopeptidase
MILAALVPDVRTAGLRQVEAFNLLPAASVIPHFDRMQLWRPMILTVLRGRLAGDQYALGIDENTALIGRLNQTWRVMGAGKVYLIDREGTQAHAAGEEFKLPDTTQERT